MIFPASSDSLRLKWAFESTKNGAWGDEPDGINDAVCIRAADFDGDLGRLTNAPRTLRSIDSEVFRKVSLRPGDLIVEKSGGGEKQLVGRSVVFEDTVPAVCSNFLARCRPSSLADEKFLNYMMLAIYNGRGTYPYIKQTTGIQNLDLSSFLNIKVKLPAIATQKRIAVFLDEKTAQIDALIEKKRHLLERLVEKRQAIITQAVTKGLNPSAPMKDSGIDWLGKIPAHWVVKRLKNLVLERIGLQMGPFGGMLTELSPEPTGFKLYGQENTISGNFSVGDRWITFDRFRDLARYQLRPGDLVITRKGSLGSCRRFPASALPGVADSDTIIVRFDEEVLRSAFAMILLHDAAYIAAQIETNRRGAILAGLNTEVVGSLLIACPPSLEQDEIRKGCQVSMAVIDAAMSAVDKSIRLLGVYRSAVVMAAITGQIEGLQ